MFDSNEPMCILIINLHINNCLICLSGDTLQVYMHVVKNLIRIQSRYKMHKLTRCEWGQIRILDNTLETFLQRIALDLVKAQILQTIKGSS